MSALDELRHKDFRDLTNVEKILRQCELDYSGNPTIADAANELAALRSQLAAKDATLAAQQKRIETLEALRKRVELATFWTDAELALKEINGWCRAAAALAGKE